MTILKFIFGCKFQFYFSSSWRWVFKLKIQVCDHEEWTLFLNKNSCLDDKLQI